jgi:hypothetical protein
MCSSEKFPSTTMFLRYNHLKIMWVEEMDEEIANLLGISRCIVRKVNTWLWTSRTEQGQITLAGL